MATVESSAAFVSRASVIGLSAEVIGKLEENNVHTFGMFAFCCPYTPGASDETPFSSAITEILGRAPSISELAGLRRLYFESHAMALAEMKIKINRTETDEPKALPAPERESRLRSQKSRLVGVLITSSTQPANSLVDKCCQQLEDQMVRYISLNKCASREQELAGAEKEKSLIFDSSGHIKMNQSDKEMSISVSSDLQVRDAMTRRALAYDQAGFISYGVLSRWIIRLFEAMLKEVPAGYRRVSIDQVMLADRELWKLVSEDTNANVSVKPDGSRPVDDSIIHFTFSSEVIFHLLPLPSSQSSRKDDSGNRDFSKVIDVKFNKRKEFKGKPKGSGKGKQSVPDGCSASWNGKPICYAFNRNGCKFATPGKRCRFGWHVCWKSNCFKNKSFKECNHSS